MKFEPMSEDLDDLPELDPAQLYRSLSDLEAFRMAALKRQGDELMGTIRGLGNSREASLAITKVEEAIMWGIRAIVR